MSAHVSRMAARMHVFFAVSSGIVPLVMCLLRLVMCLLPLASWSIACHLLPHAYFLFPWRSTYGHLPVAFCLASASDVLALAYGVLDVPL